MKILGPARLADDVLSKGLCIGCGACVSLCPYFRTHRGTTSMMFPCTQEQGRCFAYCPKTGVDLEELSQFLFGAPYGGTALGHYREVALSRAGEKYAGRRQAVQAGGTVTALVTCLLEEKLIDAAVLTGRDGFLPAGRIVTAAEEAAACGTSKYAAAPTLAALNEAVSKGYRRIGLVATPCQAMAAAQMRLHARSQNREDPIAMVIGLFCTWALDYRKMEDLLKSKLDIDSVVKIDVPPPPAEVMEFATTGGTVRVPLDEIRPLVPRACGYCPDMTAEFADVAVGMAEGIAGTNTLVTRTGRGAELVKEAAAKGYLALETMPPKNLEGLMTASSQKRRRALARLSDEEMINGDRPYLALSAATLKTIVK